MAHSRQRIMVTGAAGLLGCRLVTALARRHDTTAVTHESGIDPEVDAGVDVIRCDLTDAPETERLVEKVRPNVVVNCAAMTDVDGCERERDRAERANAGIVRNLLRSISHNGIRFVQISTDYLFDGADGPYVEDSEVRPLNVYGATKLAGETAVRSWAGSSIVIRTSALYDCRIKGGKANLFASTYERLRKGETVEAAQDLYCNPIWAINLSEAIEETIEAKITGILNIAGPEYMSRYDFSREVASHYGYSAELVKGVRLEELRRAARRPLRAGVEITKASGLLRTRLRSPSESFSHPDFVPD